MTLRPGSLYRIKLSSRKNYLMGHDEELIENWDTIKHVLFTSNNGRKIYDGEIVLFLKKSTVSFEKNLILLNIIFYHND